MLGDKVKNRIWWPLCAVMAMSSLRGVNGDELSRCKKALNGHQGGRNGGTGSVEEGRGSSSFLMGGHGAGTPAHRGSFSCSQESLNHLEHQCRTSPARQGVIIQFCFQPAWGNSITSNDSAFKMENFRPGISTGTSAVRERHRPPQELN